MSLFIRFTEKSEGTSNAIAADETENEEKDIASVIGQRGAVLGIGLLAIALASFMGVKEVE